MAEHETVTVLWVGNRTEQINTNPNTIGYGKEDSIVGWSAEGQDELKPTQITGDVISPPGLPPYFSASYQAATSDFFYDSPLTGQLVQDVQITAFLDTEFQITVRNPDGSISDVMKAGILIQMSNGDIFIRPAADTVDDWRGLPPISRVEVVSAAWHGLEMHIRAVDYAADIFEPEDIICFTRGTLIACAQGARPVETLAVGDLVQTLDHGLQPIRWIGSRRLEHELVAAPRLRPVRIRAGALGPGIPSADLLVSPQHRILVRSPTAGRLFGAAEVLVAAKQLLELDGIEIADLAAVDYFHFIFDRHEIVISNGACSESLYPGPQALKSLGRAVQEELFEIFPQLRDARDSPAAARELLSGRQGRNLAARHARNNRPLVADIRN